MGLLCAVYCVTVLSTQHHTAALSSPAKNLKTSRLQEYHLLSITNALLSSQNVPKNVVGWGSAPDPAGGAYDAPQDPVVGW